MANNLNQIVTVNIEIQQPAVDSANFDNLLIFGPPPAVAPTKPLPAVGVYSGITEVTDAGYVAIGDNADPVGVAARIAFSQNPSPAQILVAPIGAAQPLISNPVLKIITSKNALTDAVPIGTIPNTSADLPWLQITYNRAAVTAMEAEITKDGVSVFGKSLPTTANPNAYLQVVIGEPYSGNPGADAMNLPAGSEAGEYIVTLTAVDAEGRKTVITQSITFDGAHAAASGGGTFNVIPLSTDIQTALDAAAKTDGWYVLCTAGLDESLYETIAEWTESQIKLFSYTFLSDTDPVGAIYYRSFGICGIINDDDKPSAVPQANQFLNVAFTARCLAYPAGSETWANNRLAAVYPSNLSSTLMNTFKTNSSNYFIKVAGRNITMNGQVRANEWIDTIRGRDWLQNDMQLRIFNLLIMNPKIPYTNAGIAMVQNAMVASLKAARQRGIVAEDEYDDDGALVPGFTTSVPNSASITATQKASRVLVDCKFSARLAGAIHVIRVDGSLTY